MKLLCSYIEGCFFIAGKNEIWTALYTTKGTPRVHTSAKAGNNKQWENLDFFFYPDGGSDHSKNLMGFKQDQDPFSELFFFMKFQPVVLLIDKQNLHLLVGAMNCFLYRSVRLI